MRFYYLLLCLCLGLLLACTPKPSTVAAEAKPAPAATPPPEPVRVGVVESRLMPSEEVTAPARVETNPNHVGRVVLPIPGRIISLDVKLGDQVTRGQAVLTVESPDAEEAKASYLQAEAGLTQAKATQSKAQADFDRINDLFEHGAIAKKEVEAGRNQIAQAEGSVDQAKAIFERASRRLSMLGLKPGQFNQHVIVTSPMSGKVLAIQAAAGEYRNDTSAPLITIADLSTLWIASDVPESEIRHCKLGGAVDIELLAYPGEVFHGKVAQIADTVDPETRTIKVRAEFPNYGGRLRPEMSGKVRYSTAMQQMPIVPESAVIQSQNKLTVYLETAPNRYKPVEVILGKNQDHAFAVISGVKAGDRIVVEGAIYLMNK